MNQIDNGAAHVVASDTRQMVSAMDVALLHQARLCATLVEAASESRVAIASSQLVFEAVSAGMTKLVDSRASVATAIKRLTLIQRQSNLATVSLGCPGGMFNLPASARATAPDDAKLEVVFAD